MAAPMKTRVYLCKLLCQRKNSNILPVLSFHSSNVLQKKVKKAPKHINYGKIVSDYELDRISKGLPRTGTEYGPLIDRPDWSYVDGRAGNPSSGQIRRKAEQHDIACQLYDLNKEFTYTQKSSSHDLNSNNQHRDDPNHKSSRPLH